MNQKLVTPPAKEPVQVAELKSHLRVSSTEEDDLLSGLIGMARRACERFTRRVFINQTWEAAWDAVEVGNVEPGYSPLPPMARRTALVLPKCPLVSITSVTSYALIDHTATVMSSAAYYADTHAVPGKIALKDGYTWPTDLRELSALVVRYVAGYGTDVDNVEEDIKLAIKLLAAHYFEHRGDDMQAIVGADANLPREVQMLLLPYRVLRIC